MPGFAGPNEVFVLNQQAGFVGNFEPFLGGGPDAKAHRIPVHLLGNINQKFAHPLLVPRQDTRGGVFKEAMQGDVGAAHEVGLAVQIGPARGRFEVEFAHAESGCGRVSAGGGFEDVEVGLLRSPKLRGGHGQVLGDGALFAGGEAQSERAGARDDRGGLPLMDRLRQLKLHRADRVVAQQGLHGDGAQVAGGRHLDALDGRVGAEFERHAVIDAGRPAVLLKVGSGRNCGWQHAGMGADADQNLIGARFEFAGDIEDGGGETAQMLAYALAVQPDDNAELRLVDAQPRHCGDAFDTKVAAIPEPVARLAGDARRGDQGRSRGQPAADPVLNELAAFEFVHIREGGRGGVDQAGHRCTVGKALRGAVAVDGVFDLPDAVE